MRVNEERQREEERARTIDTQQAMNEWVQKQHVRDQLLRDAELKTAEKMAPPAAVIPPGHLI